MREIRGYYGVFIVFLVFGLMLPQKTLAQTDTTGTAAKTDSIIQYLTPLEYAFMMHEETKFMLRVPAFGVGAEVEILPYFTLMSQVHFSIENAEIASELYLTAQARWYYGSKKINVGSMSGNYLALGYTNPGITGGYSFEKRQLYATWGIQRRFLDYGLIDMGINLGYGDYTYPSSIPILRSSMFNKGYFLQSRGEVGLGFVFNKIKDLDADRLCAVVKCFERETFLFKINTNNLFSLFHNPEDDRTELRLKPKLSVEQKLFDLPISISLDFGLDYQWWQRKRIEIYNYHGYNNNHGYRSDFTGRLHTRYYYNLKSRIRKGKSGNGFSANYISGGVYQNYQFTSSYSRTVKRETTGYIFTTGIQRTFSDHFYFDVEVGIQKDPTTPGVTDLTFYGDIQLGLKF